MRWAHWCCILLAAYCCGVLGIPHSKGFVWEKHNAKFFTPATTKLVEGVPTLTPEQVAMGVLENMDRASSHAADTLVGSQQDKGNKNMQIKSQVHESEFGPIVVVMEGEIEGTPVWGQRVSVALNRDQLQPLAYSGYLPTDKLVSQRRSAIMSPMETAKRGVSNHHKIAFDVLRVTETPKSTKRVEEGDPYTVFTFSLKKSSISKQANEKKEEDVTVRYRPVWYGKGGEELEAAVYMEVGNDYLVVSSVDSTTLVQGSLANDASAFKYRVWADAGTGRPLVGPQGDQFFPSRTGLSDYTTLTYVEPSLLTVDTTDPWLPDGATQLSGNNVDAYADLVPPDGFSTGDLRPSTNGPNKFDYTYDVTKDPLDSVNQQSAAVTNMFYVVNWLHDWFYAAGFNEASGNAQVNNYNRGGLGGDPIQAEGQDYRGMNKANMVTPADGESPRMELYLWDPRHDASILLAAPTTQNLTAQVASFGPDNFYVTGDLVLANDGTDTVTDGCEGIQNSVSGKIVLLDRGNCQFGVKVQNAARAGAIGAIIVNNVGTTELVRMGSCSDCNGDPFVPSLSVSKNNGISLKDMLGSGTVTLTMSLSSDTILDGALDNQLVAHEWGHYLSHRLVPSLNSDQAAAMGEGWSDFVALLMTVIKEDEDIPANSDWAGTFGLFSYADQSESADAAYFGLRRYPYSTDTNKNPLTFRHISFGTPMPTGIPIGFNIDNNEVHAAGEVWCTVLWECYASLLRDSQRLTFEEAQRRMKNYLVASLKMTPSDPTFLEARDALLGVAATDPQDWILFCAAFAKRGMGLGAVAPDRYSTDFIGVVESYDCAGHVYEASVEFEPEASSCDSDGIFDNTEKASINLSLKNKGGSNITLEIMLELLSDLPYLEFPNGAVLTYHLPYLSAMEFAIPLEMNALQGLESGILNLLVHVNDVTSNGTSFTFPVTSVVNVDVRWRASAVDSMEIPRSAWMAVHGAYERQGRIEYMLTPGEVDPPKWHWRLSGEEGPYEDFMVSPDFVVANNADFVISFEHVVGLEDGYDGGFIELLVGGHWIDLTTLTTTGLAGGLWPLSTGSHNPKEGELAFTGPNLNYPYTDREEINLGRQYAGQTVAIRFHMAADEAVGWEGWDIHRVELQGVVDSTAPFPIAVRQNGYTLCQLQVCEQPSWHHRQSRRRR